MLKFRCLFSCPLSYSLSCCSSLIWFPTRKTWVAKCKAATWFPVKENCPNTPVPRGSTASPPPPQQSVRADGHTDVRDIVTRISRMDRFSRKSYPWCSAKKKILLHVSSKLVARAISHLFTAFDIILYSCQSNLKFTSSRHALCNIANLRRRIWLIY